MAEHGRDIAFLMALLALAACGTPKHMDADIEHSFVIIEENGIPVAHSNGPKFAGELFDYEPILRLVEDEGEEPLFYRAFEFVLDTAGRYIVVDRLVQNIVVFDASGRLERRFGRSGAGPGEFGTPLLHYIQGDVLHLFDSAYMRTTRYRTNGEWLGQDGRPAISFAPSPSPGMNEVLSSLTRISDDLLLLFTRGSRRDQAGVHEMARVYGVGTEEDTLWSVRTPVVQTAYMYMARTMVNLREGLGYRQEMTSMAYPFGPSPSIVYRPAVGIVVYEGWEAELKIYNLNGRLERIIRIEGIREPVTPEDRKAVRDYYRNRIAEASREDVRHRLEAQITSLSFPEMKAAFGRIRVDDNGYIYAATHDVFSAVRDYADQVAWHVFDPEGVYLGKTTRPNSPFPRFPEVFGNRLLVVEVDEETGAEIPTVYAITPIPDRLRFP